MLILLECWLIVLPVQPTREEQAAEARRQQEQAGKTSCGLLNIRTDVYQNMKTEYDATLKKIPRIKNLRRQPWRTASESSKVIIITALVLMADLAI